jgi:hypothetical protein
MEHIDRDDPKSDGHGSQNIYFSIVVFFLVTKQTQLECEVIWNKTNIIDDKTKHTQQTTKQNTQQAEASMQNWQNLMNWSLHRDMWCSMDEWYEFMPQFKERVFGGDVSKWLPKATNSIPLVCMCVYGFVCSDLRTCTLQKHAHTFRPCLCTVRG